MSAALGATLFVAGFVVIFLTDDLQRHRRALDFVGAVLIVAGITMWALIGYRLIA